MQAIFAGSFDPITLGHLDLIERSAAQFKRLFVVLAVNPKKKYMLTDDERFDLCVQSCSHLPNVVVTEYNGVLVDLCESLEVNVMVRGLRSLTDFDYEMSLAHTNKLLNPKVETLCMVTQPEHSFISSSRVRELISLKKYDILSAYLPKNVEEYITKRY